MTENTDHILSYFFKCLCVLLIVHTIYFSILKPNWSPIDEYAHMDYIEKICDGRLPKISDTISQEIYVDIQNNPIRSVNRVSQSRQELGFANYSYQAKHPPVYYTILSVPNILLKFWKVQVFNRVLILRCISYFLYVLGIMIIANIFKTLTAIKYPIPRVYPWLIIIFSLLIISHERYGLGNNALSLLFINGGLYFMLNYIKEKKNINLLKSSLLLSLSISVALTNLFIVPFLYVFLFILIKKSSRIKSFTIILMPIILTICILFIWKINTIPDKIIGDQINDLLLKYIPANQVSYWTFLKYLEIDVFTIELYPFTFYIGHLMNILFAISLFYVANQYQKIKKYHLWLFIPFIMTSICLVEMYFLNVYIDRVTWVAYRHYLGFNVFLFTMITAIFIPLLSRKIHTEIVHT